MIKVSIKDLLLAGVHFGHQKSYWNPNMKPYIFGTKNKIHIINLDITIKKINIALKEIYKLSTNKCKILFIGTKKSVKNIIKKTAIKCNQFFVNHRWLGGMLTNWCTVNKSIELLKKLEIQSNNGTFNKLTKKEALTRYKELNKLEKSIGGIKNMGRLPDAIFVIDALYERIAIKEAINLNIPIFAIVDTNSNPDGIDFVIPGNDDSIKSINLYLNLVSNTINCINY
ncbi:30S ribosomal protein S2 [Candidatus Annandia adelgestsuga]|uniref:Small ribosomal subunit protein uS2 n=1 Tax=Candidatus Annandia adelgestsuga TaxID=1302411 RepID=A0A3Q9CLR5_9ENTR|nr:30S ribosomal protein S2 [Candidatus Annandia adelgestsuga]AZP36170.1 30S ribosomal protein S2 [Candidatus Annandia adelgestsuga]